ncbi:hypothetical protein Slin15195_G112770 [Septoria linicola]|uniref:Uncharacterized protein n=1 Tax=Septoria linicola TaxID=215465 RepID=A0A9Q9B5P5_9PEZI|nr:hypothetical protein Slin15195_G112770 [Septoria linicola]
MVRGYGADMRAGEDRILTPKPRRDTALSELDSLSREVLHTLTRSSSKEVLISNLTPYSKEDVYATSNHSTQTSAALLAAADYSANMRIKDEYTETPGPDRRPTAVELKDLSREALRKLARGGSFDASVLLQELEAQDRAVDPRHACRKELRHMVAQGSAAAAKELDKRRAKDRAGYYRWREHIQAGRPSSVASYERMLARTRRGDGKRRRRKHEMRQSSQEQVAVAPSSNDEDDVMESVEVPVSDEDIEKHERAERLFEEPSEEEMAMVEGEQKEYDESGEEFEEAQESTAAPPLRTEREICLSIWEALGW